MSALQLSKMLGVSYKSAWFMAHRIRHAMSKPPLSRKLRGIVEADETNLGGKGTGKRGRGSITKTPVFSLVERNGDVRSRPIENVKFSTLKEIMLKNISKKAKVMTDHHVSRHRLHRYCNEFDFRYNFRKMNDGERSVALIGQVKNKRLIYRDSSQDANQSIHSM